MDTKISKISLSKKAQLSFDIDGDWSAEKFGIFFDRMAKLNDYYFDVLFLTSLLEDEEINKSYSVKEHKPSVNYTIRSEMLIQRKYLRVNLSLKLLHDKIINKKEQIQDEILIVKKINFASPGSIDFLGIAAVLNHFKEILFNYLPSKKLAKEVQILEEERVKLRIENLKSMGFIDVEIKAIILQEEVYLLELKEIIDNKNIKSIKYSEN